MDAKHTPTPWTARMGNVFKDGDCIAVCDTDIVEMADAYEANAAFIVRAVNSHEALVSCVEAALNMVEGDGFPPNWDWLRLALAAAKAQP